MEYMSEAFQKLRQLHKEGKVWISYKRSLDPFWIWLLWFSGGLSKMQKGNAIFKIASVIYQAFTSFWLWIPLSIIMAIFISKFYLLLMIVPLFIPAIFRSIGHGFLTYDLLRDENLLDTLWATQIVGGIISTKKKDWSKEKDDITRQVGEKYEKHYYEKYGRYHYEVYIGSYNHSDWRDELLREFK